MAIVEFGDKIIYDKPGVLMRSIFKKRSCSVNTEDWFFKIKVGLSDAPTSVERKRTTDVWEFKVYLEWWREEYTETL